MQLIETLGLSIQPDRQKILNDTYLRQMKCVIVFQSLPFKDETLVYKFIQLIKGLRFYCSLHTITVISDK